MKTLATTLALLVPMVAVGDATQDVIKEYRRQCASAETRSSIPAQGRAVSLREIQAAIARCHSRAKCDAAIFDFFGLERLDGFIEDPANNDIVLFGLPGPNTLKLDDFVVALRNVWLLYAKQEGNLITYAPPACSIDPDPRTFAELDRVSGLHAGATDLPEKWEPICRRPQEVKLFGMPDSAFAETCVHADYRMKSWVNGTMSSEGFKGSGDLAIDSVRRQISEGRKQITVPAGGINRYWFHAGDTRYQQREGATWVSRLPVTLLTEQQFLSRGQKIHGSGQVNIIAEAVADCFTQQFDNIKRNHPEFLRLEQLYRHVAIAKLLRQREMESSIRFSLQTLLENYELETVRVAKTLPGVTSYKRLTHQESSTTHYLLMPSCGGVSLNVLPVSEPARKDLDQLRVAIGGSRPQISSASWDWRVNADRQSRLLRMTPSARLQPRL